ncbi:MAG: hypothetical protein ACTH2Q_01350 [Propionibacteriaceae bacterium]
MNRRSKGRTIGEARRRARRKLDEIKAAAGSNGDWKPGHGIADYIDQVSRPAMEKAGLAPLTLDRYELALGLLLGDCDNGGHRHRHGLRRHTIASGTRFQALEDLLTEIASLHGRETARQSRTVLTKYVQTRLTRDELIQGNPIAGVSLDELTGTRKAGRTRGGRALTVDEYETVLVHLLDLDPAGGVVRRQGRWSLEHLVAKRRNAIDQALLQAASGLRSTEANLIGWQNVEDDDHTMSIRITEDVAKGGVHRVVLILDDRVIERMRERREHSRSKEFVIGSPTDPMRPWDRDNRNKAARDLYLEIAEETGVAVLETERSHVWRTTLHTLYGDEVPTAVLDSQFGNSEQVRARHYTDASDLSALGEAARNRRTS